MKPIIGEIIISCSSEPDETFLRPDWEVDDRMEPMIYIYNIVANEGRAFYKLEARIDILPDRIDVFYITYFCTHTNAFINHTDLCSLSQLEIVNEYKFGAFPDWDGERFNAHIVTTSGVLGLQFVFNLVDIRKQVLAFIMSMNTHASGMQTELVDQTLIPLLDSSEIDKKDRWGRSSTFISSEFKGSLPEIFSMGQLELLYDLGMVKMVMRVSADVTIGSQYERFGIISDDSFDNDPDGSIRSHFETKAHMHAFIQENLEVFDTN